MVKWGQEGSVTGLISSREPLNRLWKMYFTGSINHSFSAKDYNIIWFC